MPIKKIKKVKRKEKPMAAPPSVTGWEYFVDEIPTTYTTQEMQARCNEIGAEGWQLIIIGQYSSTPGTVRVWFMRQGSPAPIKEG